MNTSPCLAVIALVAAACSTGAPATPSAEAPSARATASAVAISAAPTTATTTGPAGVQAWPTTFDVELRGTYTVDPPFRIPFSITVDEGGWFSGHLHETFIDLQRFDGITQQFPNRMLGFADPDHFRGSGDIPIASLTPDSALDLLAARASLQTSNRVAQTLFGIDGVRMDVHSGTGSNPLFGNGTDHFGLGPQLDIRLVVLPRDGRLFVVCVLAVTGDLDGAWKQALPILTSVQLADEPFGAAEIP
ncbi:MAG TPA: hypothetical protein VJ850_11870 [Candidatus Limnocylindrales bacterium]|nr:hypothetical protein [Candidatus Limnocylindrales bacterium]